jgi:chromosome segregation ATPase
LQQDKNNVQKRLVDNKKSVDALTKQKKKIPPDLSADIANNQMVNAKLDQQISERKLVIENTRQRFEQDKQRYIALKYPNASNPPGTLVPVNDVAEKTTSKSVTPSGR